MPTTIEVNKQSVEALLGSGKTKPFVIPEYQLHMLGQVSKLKLFLKICGSLQLLAVVLNVMDLIF